jgi:hypothetical protein
LAIPGSVRECANRQGYTVLSSRAKLRFGGGTIHTVLTFYLGGESVDVTAHNTTAQGAQHMNTQHNTDELTRLREILRMNDERLARAEQRNDIARITYYSRQVGTLAAEIRAIEQRRKEERKAS